MIIRVRKRIFIAVEGKSEQAFITLLQEWADKKRLNVHLDTVALQGGGYQSMLTKTKHQLKIHQSHKNKPTCSILIIDADRGLLGDDHWSLDKLHEEASHHKISVCFQHPNLEGTLLRMLPGMENMKPYARDAEKLLKKAWKDYDKPADAYMLRNKYALEDLLRVAEVDDELKKLLALIGLI